MAELAGRLAPIFVLAGTTAMTGATGAKVNGADNASYQRVADLLEITQFGDTSKKRIKGLMDTTFNVSGNYDPLDTTGQNVLDNVGGEVFIGVYPQGTGVAGKQVRSLIESFEISMDPQGKQTFNATLQGVADPVALPLRP